MLAIHNAKVFFFLVLISLLDTENLLGVKNKIIEQYDLILKLELSPKNVTVTQQPQIRPVHPLMKDITRNKVILNNIKNK